MKDFEMSTTNTEIPALTQEPDDDDEPIEYKIAAVVFKYYSPIQIIIALFGNIMILLVFSRKTMRGSVTSFLFRVLAVADTYMILVTLIPEVMLELGGSSEAYATDSQCKVHGYIYFAGRTYAVWVLLLIVFERFIGVNFPHKASSMITFRRAKIAVVTLFIVIYLLYAMIPVVMKVKYVYSDKGEIINYFCTVSYEVLPNFTKLVFPWYDMFLYAVIPFVVMLAANISIIYRLVQASRMRVQTTGDSNDVTGTTAMLLGISFGFFACTMPYWASYFERKVNGGIGSPKSYLFWALSAVLVNMNHCINFYIYCLTGTRFRKELRAMFGCAEKDRVATSFTGSTRVSKVEVNAVA